MCLCWVPLDQCSSQSLNPDVSQACIHLCTQLGGICFQAHSHDCWQIYILGVCKPETSFHSAAYTWQLASSGWAGRTDQPWWSFITVLYHLTSEGMPHPLCHSLVYCQKQATKSSPRQREEDCPQVWVPDGKDNWVPSWRHPMKVC